MNSGPGALHACRTQVTWIASSLFLKRDSNENKKQTSCDIRQLKLALSSSTKSGNPSVLFQPNDISQLNQGSESQPLGKDFQETGPCEGTYWPGGAITFPPHPREMVWQPQQQQDLRCSKTQCHPVPGPSCF